MVVVADPGPCEGSVDACPSRAGVFEGFDDHDHGAFAEDESVAAGVPGA